MGTMIRMVLNYHSCNCPKYSLHGSMLHPDSLYGLRHVINWTANIRTTIWYIEYTSGYTFAYPMDQSITSLLPDGCRLTFGTWLPLSGARWSPVPLDPGWFPGNALFPAREPTVSSKMWARSGFFSRALNLPVITWWEWIMMDHNGSRAQDGGGFRSWK